MMGTRSGRNSVTRRRSRSASRGGETDSDTNPLLRSVAIPVKDSPLMSAGGSVKTPSAPVISHYIPGLASAAAAAASPHGSSSSRQQQLFSDSQHDAVDRTLLPTISSAQTGSGTGIGNTATGGRALSDRNKSAAAAAAAGDVEDNDEDQGSPKIIAFLFITAIILVYVMYLRLPTLPPDEAAKIVLPRSIAQVRDLAQVLLKYRDEHFSLVLGFFAAVYIFLQTFAIPGAIFLSILAGPLFGLPLGLLIVSLVATTGASMCYTLSKTLGAGIVRRKFPTQIASFRERIQSHQDNLFFYLLFLRISPLLPNWFISISSPILKIPLRTFAAATFIGLMPGNYLHITTGMSLNSLTSDGPMVDTKALITLLGVACLALIPVMCKKRFEAYDRSSIKKPGFE